MKTIDLCLLYSKGSIESCLMDLFDISKQQLKKHNLNKKFLKSTVKKNQLISLPIDLVNHLKINPIYQGPKVETLFSDENFIILHKPHKVHMFALGYSEQNNLLSYLRMNNSKCLSVNESNYDRGLIYRLDYETSGIVYYAKTDDVYQYMRNNFNDTILEKNYFAIVEGHFNKQGEHTHYLKSSGVKGHKILVLNNEESQTQMANLKVELIQYNPEKNVSLLKVYLKTGLRHQIRCQLSHLGFPIVGDELYNGQKADRLFLHAFQYKFILNTKKYDFECPVDLLFKNFFNFNSCS